MALNYGEELWEAGFRLSLIYNLESVVLIEGY